MFSAKRPQGVTRTLSDAERGGAERPGDGFPSVGAEETCGVPSQPAGRGRTPPLNTYQNAELRRLVQNLLGVLFSSFLRCGHPLDKVLLFFEERGHIGV